MIMAQHIKYVQHTIRTNLHTTIDDTNLTVADIKKIVDEQFKAMDTEVEGILHDHLVTVKDANKKSRAAMEELHSHLEAELKAQEQEEQRYNEAQDKAHKDKKAKDDAHTKGAETHVNQIFDHVYDIAKKMGDADIDSLIKPATVKEWEQLITDTETGKINYDDAVKKMEEVITKDSAALKLAEATGCFELIHEDGGAKGVTEVTNFRSLLKHIKWLPQYSAVLEEFASWKSGDKTIQQVLVWVQEQVSAGKLDDRWLAAAVKPAATATTTTTTTTATAQEGK
jgi:hypothetical protein